MTAELLQKLISPAFDDNVLLEILRKSSGFKQVVLNDFKIKDGSTNKGDSYLSSVVRIDINGTARTGQNEEKNIRCAVIVKTLPQNIGRRKSFRSTDFFRNEVIFYNEIWDTLLKFQESNSIKSKLLPVCYSALADGLNDYVALEDMNDQNYVPFRRQDPLDYGTVVTIIQLFAKFHGLSFAYKNQFPKVFQQLANTIQETYFAEKFRTWYKDFHSSLIAVARDAIEKELPKKYLDKYNDVVKKDLFGRMVSIASNKNYKYSVITQGDTWLPNFLVRYDSNNKPEDIKMIDFQLSRCCSPSCDLSFFLYSSASYELLNTRWDDIMKEYHSSFTKFVSDLGTDPSVFTLEEFKIDMKKNALLGVGMSMEALPVQMLDDSEAFDLDSIQGEDAVPIATVWKVHPIKTKEGRERIANMFKHAVDMEFV